MFIKFFTSLRLYAAFAVSALCFLYYFLIRKTAKLEEQNKALNDTIDEFSTDAEKIIEAQNDVIKIASNPTPDDEYFYRWVRTKGKNTDV